MSPHKRSAWPSHRHYPRMARVNEVLREVLADEIELVAGTDSRLELVTVTAVSCEPDLRHATVLLASLPEPARAALGEARTRLQAAVAHQVRLKRTPLLTFEADPAVAAGERVEEILRSIHAAEKTSAAGAGDGGTLGPGGSDSAGGGPVGPGPESDAAPARGRAGGPAAEAGGEADPDGLTAGGGPGPAGEARGQGPRA
jgi:ribosome-binding factor A